MIQLKNKKTGEIITFPTPDYEIIEGGGDYLIDEKTGEIDLEHEH